MDGAAQRCLRRVFKELWWTALLSAAQRYLQRALEQVLGGGAAQRRFRRIFKEL